MDSVNIEIGTTDFCRTTLKPSREESNSAFGLEEGVDVGEGGP